MSADSSGSGKPVDGSSPGSSKPGTSTKADGGPRSDPIEESGDSLPSKPQSSSPTEFLNTNRRRVGTQSLHSTSGSSGRYQTSTKGGGGPRSDPVDESRSSLPPKSPISRTSTKADGGPRSDPIEESEHSLPSQPQSSSATEFLNTNRRRVGTQSLHSTSGSSGKLLSQTSTKGGGGLRGDPVDESGGSLPPKSPISTPTTQTDTSTDRGRVGTQSLHSTSGSSNRLSSRSSSNSSTKPRQGDMLEMKKEKSSEICPTTTLSHSLQGTNQSDQPRTFDNKLLPGTANTLIDSHQEEAQHALNRQKITRNIRINVQIGSQHHTEFYLPCDWEEYFEWTYCLMNCSCRETLLNELNKIGSSMRLVMNKPPIFMFSESQGDFVEPLQHSFRKTVKQNNIICYMFDLDMSRPENDFKMFCEKCKDNEKYQSVLISWDKLDEKVIICLVGEKTQVELVKPVVESELKMKSSINYEDNAKPFTTRISLKGKGPKLLRTLKENLETNFQVKISFEPNSEIEITGETKDVVKKLFERVKEISKRIQTLELPKEHTMFLLHSKKAQLYIKTELRMQFDWKIHFLPIEIDEPAVLHVVEENDTELKDISLKIMKCIFLIHSTDKLCQMFTSDLGQRLRKHIAEKYEGKVQIILDSTSLPCCVGTKDLEEKIKILLAKYVFNREIIKLPSEEVWRFCQKLSIFQNIQNIAKENCCEVQLAEYQLAMKINGPASLVSDCCRNIEMEIRNISSKTVILMDTPNESEITKVLLKWNAEKRCFVSLRSDKSKNSAPWKKWVDKKGMNINLVYSVNLNISQEIQEDEFKVVLKPEELEGARSKNPMEHIPDSPYHLQLLIPSSKNGKIKDIVTTRFKDILKFNKENWKKRSMIVDCDRISEQELNITMKNMCHTLDTTDASDLCITKCEFCDKRLDLFECMTRVIDTHLYKKHYEVMEWKGRSIEMDVFTGQLAQQKGFDVLVNSASKSLDLKAGYVSKTILNAAGSEIQDELYKRYRGGLREGDIAVTNGYDLSCRHVFHGALRGYNPVEKLWSLRKTIRTCLEKADELKMESIAFPALGTGNLGYKHSDVANVLFDEVEAYEKKVKVGTLNRVCCVIYENDSNAVEEFTRRHLLWKQDHMVQSAPKQVVVTSDKPDVIEEICQELKQSKHHTTSLSEPPKAEMTEAMRLGIQSTTGEDAESNIIGKKNKGSSQYLDNLSEEKRCLIVKGKEDFERDAYAWEKRLRNDFHNLAENIVCPFHHPDQALVQFASENDVAGVLKEHNLNEKYEIQEFPPQAVVGLEAVVSSRMVGLLRQRQITMTEIRSKSGVVVHQKDNNTIVLCGNILEIEAAFNFFSSLVNDTSSDVKDINEEKLPLKGQMSLGHKLSVSGLMDKEMNGDSLMKQQQISEKVSDISRSQRIKSTSGKERKQLNESSVSTEASSSKLKLDASNIVELKCTAEEVIKLKHFYGNLMHVEDTKRQDQSHISLLFHDEGTKIKVEESLQKIKDMPCSTIQLHKMFDGIEDFLAKQCTKDALCYLSKDRRHIEIIGIERGNLTKFKEELNRLLNVESQTVKEIHESLEEEVYVTNAGISVFVKCTSLLNIGKQVDAIVCPISNQCDIESGLSRAIANLAGPKYVKDLLDIFEKNEKMFPEEFVCVIPSRNFKACKYVINVTTKQWEQGEKESRACELFLLQQMSHVLLKAEESGIRSIAIPAICSGNCRFPKETCALCYATGVLMYSRTVRHNTKGLNKISFVDQSAEIITYIKSVFSQPNVEEITSMKEQELLRKSDASVLFPYFVCQDGIFFLSENLKLRVLDSKVSSQNPSKRTLVYNESLGKSVKDKWLSDYKKKQIVGSKDVFFCKQKLEISKIPDLVFPGLDNPASETFSQALSTFYLKIFRESERQNVCHMMLPFYGSVKGNVDASRKSAECLINQLHRFAARLTSKSLVDIVMPIADKDAREIMKQEIELYVERERAGFHEFIKKKI